MKRICIYIFCYGTTVPFEAAQAINVVAQGTYNININVIAITGIIGT